MKTENITATNPMPCSPETAAALYAQLEYYREYVPYMLGTSHEKYATTAEAQITDAAIAAYRNETGVKPLYTA